MAYHTRYRFISSLIIIATHIILWISLPPSLSPTPLTWDLGAGAPAGSPSTHARRAPAPLRAPASRRRRRRADQGLPQRRRRRGEQPGGFPVSLAAKRSRHTRTHAILQHAIPASRTPRPRARRRRRHAQDRLVQRRARRRPALRRRLSCGGCWPVRLGRRSPAPA
jgi:hypothetical protein